MGLRPPPVSWISLDATDIFYLSGTHGSVRTSSSSATAIRQAAQVGAETNILAYLNAPDPELEGLYSMGTRVGQALDQMQVQLVGAPTYSVFVYRPRIDHIFNLRRMFTTLSELADAGLPVIPTVFYAREMDIVGWRSWLLGHPQVWLIGVVVQRQSNPFFEDQIRQISRIQKDLESAGRYLHVILYGVGSPARAERAKQIGLRRFACVSSHAAMAAGHGRLLDSKEGKLRVRRADPQMSKHEIFARNLRLQAELFAQITPNGDGLISAPDSLWIEDHSWSDIDA